MKAGLFSCLLVLMPPLVLAQGQTLHDESCLQCHASITGGNANSLYTRTDHNVTSFSALQKRVKGCAVAADANWSNEQRASVVKYLSETFYQF